MAPTRTYSFEADDEGSLSHHRQEQDPHYYDSPSHERAYTSPPAEPPSPVSLSHARPYTSQSSRISADISREHSTIRYTDRSPSPPPPPPPPHRISPSMSLRNDAGPQQYHLGASVPMEDLRRGVPTEGQRLQPTSERTYMIAASNMRAPPQSSSQQNQVQMDSPRVPSYYMQRPPSGLHENSYSSSAPFAAHAATPGSTTPTGSYDPYSSRYSGRSIPVADEYMPAQHYRASGYGYHDSPYHASGTNIDLTVSDASINPQHIVDDGDDDFTAQSRAQAYPMQQQRDLGSSGPVPIAAAHMPKSGVLGGLFSRQSKNYTASGTYRPVDNSGEKSDWLVNENKKRKRNSWLCGIGIGLVVIVALAAGVLGGILSMRHKSSNSGSDNTASGDTAANGDLDINSPEIKGLLHNPNLHKVFPGVDYTPWGVQYPLCMTYPPSQNNVTRDMAVLSQLTNTVRLYGTDCNQTEMVLHAIDRLKLTNMKVWLGVWIDTNDTTTERQLAQMYKILADVPDVSIFKGAIIGNEALFRAGLDKSQSETQLIQIMQEVKSNFTTLGYNLPVATSDLGDNWNAQLAEVTDYVMSNIHPFFAGVSAEEAASWTWSFWNQHDVPLTTGLPNVKQIISETGWPSDGGTDCGGTDGDCAAGQSGATASVANMNTYMENWVCQALANGTEYFWFEAFDEPWKVQYDTPGKEWEDKWGLMDAGRNLKPGIKIPSCGGQTVS